MNYRYFSQSDFDQADPPCSIHDMHPRLLEMLDVARFHAGMPIVITSAYRTVDHELKQGRDGSSSHTKGVAVDIASASSRHRFVIVSALLKAGFRRIGIGPDFIHVDIDGDKTQDLIWHYY